MRWLAAATLALAASRAAAATAYVSDELVLGVYAEENNQGQRLATLHSGARVETLSSSADYIQVRLADGTTGWVRSTFLTSKEPASVRVKELQEELDRTRATTPALAEAAARSEVQRLTRELAAQRSAAPAANAASPGSGSTSALSLRVAAWLGAAAVLAGLGCGYWLGYAALARRVRRKFGGIKVY